MVLCVLVIINNFPSFLFSSCDLKKLFIYFLFFPAIKCSPISIGNANYSTTIAGNTALGKCDDSYYGSPTLYCDLTGHWNQTINGNPCSSIFFIY